MAETTTPPPPDHSTAKRSTAAQAGRRARAPPQLEHGARKRTAANGRTPTRRTGRRTRTTAKNQTRDAAKANATAAKHAPLPRAAGSPSAPRSCTSARRSRRVTASSASPATLVDRFGTPRRPPSASVKKDSSRFERRGNTARNQLERDVRKARTRLERAVRTRRRNAERVAHAAHNVVTEARRGRRPVGARDRHAGSRPSPRTASPRWSSTPVSPARRGGERRAGKPAGLISRRQDSPGLETAGGCSTLSSLNRRLATRGGPSVFKGSHERLTARAYGRAMFAALVTTLALAAAPGFSTKIDNPYWPMKPGTRWVSRDRARSDDAAHRRPRHEPTKRVASGIDVLIVHDRATEHGHGRRGHVRLLRPGRKGNVWYQGEDTTEFENGKPVSKKGHGRRASTAPGRAS